MYPISKNTAPTGRRHLELSFRTSVTVAKEDGIRALIPVFEQARWFELETCWRVSRAGVSEDLTRAFIEEEYLAFPVGSG